MSSMKSLAVNAIVFSEDEQKVLAILRRDTPVWVLPGGAVEQDETPEAAVVREVLEETGCHVTICRKSAVYTPLNRLTSTTHLFVCKILSGAPTTGAETRDIAFYSLNALPRDFFYIHRHFIEDALNNPSRIIETTLSQVTYFALLQYLFRHPIRGFRAILSRIGLPFNSP